MAAAEVPTEPRQIRVNGDLADMLGWIEDMEGNETIAQIVEPWLRAPVEARYAKIRKQAEATATARGIKFIPGKVPPRPRRKRRE